MKEPKKGGFGIQVRSEANCKSAIRAGIKNLAADPCSQGPACLGDDRLRDLG